MWHNNRCLSSWQGNNCTGSCLQRFNTWRFQSPRPYFPTQVQGGWCSKKSWTHGSLSWSYNAGWVGACCCFMRNSGWWWLYGKITKASSICTSRKLKNHFNCWSNQVCLHTVDNSFTSSISCQFLLHFTKNQWIALMVLCSLHLNFVNPYFRTITLSLQRFKWVLLLVLFVIKLSSTYLNISY